MFISLADFDIYYGMASLLNLYSVNWAYSESQNVKRISNG